MEETNWQRATHMVGLIVIIVTVGVIWLAVLFRYTGLLGALMALLLAGSCFGAPFFRQEFGSIPITADRLLLCLVVVLYLFLRIGRIIPTKPWNWTDVLVVLFVVLLGLSAYRASGNVDSTKSFGRLIVFYIIPLMLYMIARETPLSDRSIMLAFRVFAVFGFYLAFTSIAEVTGTSQLVFPKYIMSEDHFEFLGRGRGPFLNPIVNGLYMVLGLCGVFLAWPAMGRVGRWLGMMAIPVYAAGIFCTLTRSVWLGAGLALGLLVCHALPRRVAIGSLGLTTVLAGLFVFANWDTLRAFKRDRHVSVSEMTESARLRPILATVAWEMFQDRPIWGCGFGHYSEHSARYISTRPTKLPLDKARDYVQHNVVLSLLTETGLIGVTLLLAVWALWCRTALMLWRGPFDQSSRKLGLLFLAVFLTYLTSGMFHEIALIPMANTVVFLLAGLCRQQVPGPDLGRHELSSAGLDTINPSAIA